MQSASSRRFSGQFLRRCFSSSARRLEIRDVKALSQRLIPKYRGQYLLQDLIPDLTCVF
jgi:NADH kinase